MKKLIFILLSMAVLTSCTPAQPTGANKENDKLTVYTSFYAMYDFTKEIAGDRAEVINMTPPATEPHDWEPTAADIKNLSVADVFVYNGAHMESWVHEVLDSINNPDLKVVEASSAVKNQLESDPHVWLDPENARLEMSLICETLAQADPQNAEYYTSNFTAYRENLEQLDDEYKETVSTFTSKDIVVSHEAYGYLCKKYGLNQIPVEGLQTEGDPSPAKMAEIIDFIKNNQIRYVFFEELKGDKIAKAIADETETQVLELNPFESDTNGYIEVMEENLNNLKIALGSN